MFVYDFIYPKIHKCMHVYEVLFMFFYVCMEQRMNLSKKKIHFRDILTMLFFILPATETSFAVDAANTHLYVKLFSVPSFVQNNFIILFS